MKHNVILFCSLLASGIVTAQNTSPWPATGNVGIGTTTPQASLHIKNETVGAKLLQLSDAVYTSWWEQNAYNLTLQSSANLHVNFGNFSNRNTFRLESAANAARFWLSANYGAFINGYNGFKIGSNEKFGFQTVGNNVAYYAIGTVYTNNDNSGLTFFSKNAGTEMEAMRIASTGNVGVGTTAPATPLHVNGNVTINKTIIGEVSHATLTLGDGQGSTLNWGTGVNMSRVMCGGPVTLWTNSLERFRLTAQGYVGINTSSPSAMLHVNGSVRFGVLVADNTKDLVLVADANGNVYTRTAASLGGGSANAWTIDGTTTGSASTKLGTTGNFDLPLITNNVEAMRVTATGNVGIGTANPQAKLAVNGDVYAKKVKVIAAGWPVWPDYVFEESYDLPSLTSVEAFIKKNKHLPEVPSAKEVQAKGIDLGDNQALLLKKIEELTLYMIDQQKQINQLKEELHEAKKE